MKTTLNFNDSLIKDTKMLAAKTGRTLTAVIEEALRSYLYSYTVNDSPNKGTFRLTTWNNGELAPGVDGASYSKLVEMMDDGLSPEKIR